MCRAWCRERASGKTGHSRRSLKDVAKYFEGNKVFKNLRVGLKMGLGFGCVVLLLVVIAIGAIRALADLNRNIENIVNFEYPKIELSNKMKDEIGRAHV